MGGDQLNTTLRLSIQQNDGSCYHHFISISENNKTQTVIPNVYQLLDVRCSLTICECTHLFKTFEENKNMVVNMFSFCVDISGYLITL